MKYLIFLLISFQSFADEVNVFIGGWSKHFNVKKEYNENHNMLAVQYRNVMFSPYFINSEDNVSQYIGYYDHLYKQANHSVWYTAGFVSGYKDMIATGQIGYSYSKMISSNTGVGFNLSAMPVPIKGKIKGVAVISIGLKYKF